MTPKKPTYEELEERLAEVEKVITALRSGEVDAIVTNDNITLMRLREAEEALRKSELWLNTTLRSIGDAVITTDDKGRVTFINPVAEQLTGWEEKQALGRELKDVFNIIHEHTGEQVEDPVDRILREGVVVGLASDTMLVSRDGTKYSISDSGAPIKMATGNIIGTVIVFQDITDQKRLEERFRQAQKMEAIGQLAGGVAHNINNLLSIIIGNLGLAIGSAPEAIHSFIADAQKGADRAAVLVQQILAFSRKSRMELESVDLNRTVDEVSRILQNTVDHRIEIEVRKEESLPCVHADERQMQSVLMTLCFNARDAIEKVMSGEIERARPGESFVIGIRTETEVVDKQYCAGQPDARPGRFVALSVSDNGSGIDAQTQRHLFEPFFTTKGLAEGIGLGLASVYGYIQQHKGWIDVTTEFREGTTFKVYLPIEEVEP